MGLAGLSGGLPTFSLRLLVAQLRSRVGELSDLRLAYLEGEVARMAREEEADMD